MLISQKKAVAQIRAETGLSLTRCVQIMRGLPRTQDGAREKVHVKQLQDAIAEANRPPVVEEESRVRFSPKTRERILRECL